MHVQHNIHNAKLQGPCLCQHGSYATGTLEHFGLLRTQYEHFGNTSHTLLPADGGASRSVLAEPAG